MIYSQIILPTWISGNSKTIIGSMFSNIAELLIKSISEGNATFSTSDHLPQLFFFPELYLQEKC